MHGLSLLEFFAWHAFWSTPSLWPPSRLFPSANPHRADACRRRSRSARRPACSAIWTTFSRVQLGVTLCSLALGWIANRWPPLLSRLDRRSAQPSAHAMPMPTWPPSRPSSSARRHHLLQVVIGELVAKSPPCAAPSPRRRRRAAHALLHGRWPARPAPPQGLGRRHPARLRHSMTERAQVHSPRTQADRHRRPPHGRPCPLPGDAHHRALELDDVPVREIMTPRQKIFSCLRICPSKRPAPSHRAPPLRVPSTTKLAAPSTSSASSTPRTRRLIFYAQAFRVTRKKWVTRYAGWPSLDFQTGESKNPSQLIS